MPYFPDTRSNPDDRVRPQLPEKRQPGPVLNGPMVRNACIDAVRKLDPRTLWRNTVMFLVEIGAVLTTIVFIGALANANDEPTWFAGWITAWLWFTVLFANVAEAIAEGRGKAQADTLRKTRKETSAKILIGGEQGRVEQRSSSDLHVGDLVLVEVNDIIPSDGEVVSGIAFVSEAAITGESAPVLKEPGTDTSSSVTGGTQVISDSLVIRITAEPGKTFLDRMISLVEGAARQKTPNEIALTVLLAGLTIIFLVVVVTLERFAEYAESPVSITVLIALLVTLIPTTIGALLSAIGIAGMDRLVQRNVLAMSGRAVEAAGDVQTLLLDKTGTITYGNRMASRFFPAPGVDQECLIDAAVRSSLADDTPEGKSIVDLGGRLGYRLDRADIDGAELIPFTAETRLSGIRLDGRETLKGAVDAVQRIVDGMPATLIDQTRQIAQRGSTPLVVVDHGRALGAIELKDTVKPGIAQRFADLRAMGIRTIMITGDNRLTAEVIAHEA
jgi:K+-transporting ATPase ATPase B chain